MLCNMKIAVLMTCHDRVGTTIECLHRLYDCELPRGATFDVWLNDDGSTDGTGAKVSLVFPSVNVIKGSGHDYWCGGMRRAWGVASRHFDYDGYLWLNDDTLLTKEALRVILDDADRRERGIVVGSISGHDGKTATYGGEDEKGFVVPDGTWHRLRQMNGNAVWIPRAVFHRLGNFAQYLTHALGDCDYSRSAVRAGIPVWLTPRYIGICDRHPRADAWKRPDVPLLRRFRSLYSPLGGNEPLVLFRYCLKHDGVLVALKLFVGNHLRVLFPGRWQ